MKSVYAAAVLMLFALVLHQAASSFVEIHSGDQLKEEMKSAGDKLVLIFYKSESSIGPGRLLKPAIEDLGRIYDDKIVILVIDIDQNGDLEEVKKVTRVPTFEFMRNGHVLDKLDTLLEVAPHVVEDYIKRHIH